MILLKYKNTLADKLIVPVFFIIFFSIGTFIFNDYGISWDEPFQRNLGKMTYDYIFHNDETLLSHRERFHGQILEAGLYLLEKISFTSSTRQVYLTRHFANFCIFFSGCLFFYLLCKKQFKSRRTALMGVLFLILSPRIFAHAFYNSKDIPFMSIFIISMYTLCLYMENKSFKTAAIHALICALLTATRVLGLLVPFFTGLLICLEIAFKKKSSENYFFKKTLFTLCSFTGIYVISTIIFWPVLWKSPFFQFFSALKHMSNYPWTGTMLYMGSFIKSTELPWHYIPVWITLTTPPLYLLFFITGSASFFIPGKYKNNSNILNDLATALWIITPVLTIIVLNSVIYDAWRHLFFIYPAIILLTLKGFYITNNFIKNHFLTTKKKRLIKNILYIFFTISLFKILYFMIISHPFQNIYFNIFAGNKSELKYKFELDYWGLSYRKGLEYILKNNSSNNIKIYSDHLPGLANSLILPENQQKRFIYQNNPDQADYFITNYRWHPYRFKASRYFDLYIDKINLMSVYKLK